MDTSWATWMLPRLPRLCVVLVTVPLGLWADPTWILDPSGTGIHLWLVEEELLVNLSGKKISAFFKLEFDHKMHQFFFGVRHICFPVTLIELERVFFRVQNVQETKLSFWHTRICQFCFFYAPLRTWKRFTCSWVYVIFQTYAKLSEHFLILETKVCNKEMRDKCDDVNEKLFKGQKGHPS